MGEMPRVAFSLHDALTRWEASTFPLLVVTGLVAAGVWYLRADWMLAQRGRRWRTRRTVSFFLGLVAVDLALQSPVATMTGTYFPAHVIQHLLLMAVAPPLLAMGAPSTLFLQTASRRNKERWLAVLRSRPFAVLTHPLLVSFLYYGVMFVFFLTSLINLAMTHMWLMDILNVFFLLGGLLFWWPMVGIDPIIHWKLGFGARMFLVLIGTAIDAFLGVAILNLSHPIASMYSIGSSRAGGGVLWAAADVLAVTAFLPIYLQWVHSEERAGKRLNQRLDREMADAAGRPAPAAAAGAEPAVAAGQLSAWEASWRQRTGAVPTMAGPPPEGRADLVAPPAVTGAYAAMEGIPGPAGGWDTEAAGEGGWDVVLPEWQSEAHDPAVSPGSRKGFWLRSGRNGS